MERQHEFAGTLVLDNKPYRIVYGKEKRAWQQSLVQEPPWVGGSPPLTSDPEYTWHLGGLKSQPGIPGTSEYGKNTDCRHPFQIGPSPRITVVDINSKETTPTGWAVTSFFEALGYLWLVKGRYLMRIDPTDDSVALSKDFGGAEVGVMGLRWESDTGLVTTDSSSRSLYRISQSGLQLPTGPDNWEQTGDVSAYRLAAGINRLFKVDKHGLLRNISSGLDPMAESNYADEIQCGRTDTIPTGIVSYDRTVFVGKPEGLFGVDEDGLGVPLIKRMPFHKDNCYGLTSYDPYALVPHIRGLYRFAPGIVESCGLERELLNDSPVKGRWRGFANDGQWVFGIMSVPIFGDNPTDETYIMVAREPTGNEPSFSAFLWDTWLYLPPGASVSALPNNIAANCQAIHLSTLWDPPRLYFGYPTGQAAYTELADLSSDFSDQALVAQPGYFKQGTYIGDGGVKSITGLGFRPKVVVVRGDTSNFSKAMMRIDTMSASINVGTDWQDQGISSLDSDGFTVTLTTDADPNRGRTNDVGITYYWYAFGGNDVETGTYVGTGASPHTIAGVSFPPVMVWILRLDGYFPVHRTSIMGVRDYDFGSDSGATNRIQSLDADGFTLGAGGGPFDTDVNESGITYHYIAFKASSSLAFGSYAGDGSDNRNLPVIPLSFNPDLVQIRADAGQSPIFRVKSLPGDASFFYDGGLNDPNLIQSLTSVAGQFQIGTEAEVNHPAIPIYYFFAVVSPTMAPPTRVRHYATSCIRYTPKKHFGDRGGRKDFPKLDVVGEGLGPGSLYRVSVSIDDEAFAEVGTINSNGKKTLVVSSDTPKAGFRAQYSFEYVSNDDLNNGLLTYFEPFASPQPRKIPIYTIRLYLAGGLQTDKAIIGRTANEQMTDLMALSEKADLVLCQDAPWERALGDPTDSSVYVRSVNLVEASQEGSRDPEFIVEVTIQRRESE